MQFPPYRLIPAGEAYRRWALPVWPRPYFGAARRSSRPEALRGWRGAGHVRGQRDTRGPDDVRDPAGALEPDLLEAGPRVHLPRGRVRQGRRVVRDHVAARGEAADHEEMPVGLGEQESGQLSVDRGDEGDPGLDEALRLSERAEARHESVETVPRCVRRVEWPVPRPAVVPVEGVSCGVIHVAVRVSPARELSEIGRARTG